MIYHRTLVLWAFLMMTLFVTQAQIPQKNVTVKGNNQFAIELYQQLIKTKKNNIFLSPYSISSALAMTYAGAKGSTATEMARTLHFSKKTLHNDCKLLANHFNNINTKDLQLSIANALWGERTQRFLPAYLKLNNDYYKAKLDTLDFIKHPEKSRLIINKWVETKTKDKIKNLIPKKLIIPNTRLVLTNAIYFNGKWKHKFLKSQNRKMAFTAGTQTFPNIQFMRKRHYFKYTENATLQAIELPYAGDKISMMILLPKDKNGLDKIEREFTTDGYEQLTRQFFNTDVILSLPKFKMTLDLKLKEILKSMGMKTAFNNYADFSGMTGKKNLKISEVVHKAFVEISEKGTEAAAATAVIMDQVKSTSVNNDPPVKPKIFKADHPFTFIIKDNTTGSILFMGRFTQPKQAS